MALQNGCTGQELIAEINGLVESSQQHEQSISLLKDDGFHVGDIRNSARETLGGNYLLCNGDYIFSNDGFEELIDIMQNNGQTWYHEQRISHASVLDDGKLVVSGDDIYAFYKDITNGGCTVRVYNGYENLILNNYNQFKVLDSLNAQSIHSAVAFQDKLFVIYTYSDKNNTYFRLASASVNNLLSWQTIDGFACSNIGLTQLKMIVENDILLITCASYSSSTYNSSMSYWFTTDGTTLSNGSFNIITDGGGYGTPSYYVGFQNDSCVFSISAPSTSKTSDLYIVSNNASLTGSWSKVVFESRTGGNIVYYDGYYWSVQTPYNQATKICRTSNLSSNAWEDFSDFSSSNTNVMVRGDMLILGNQKYDKLQNKFVQLENDELKGCALTKDGASARNCAGENDDVRIEYVSDGYTDIFCIPKSFQISTIPTISESTSYYAYIKAKE